MLGSILDSAERGAADVTPPPPTALPVSPTPTPDATRSVVYEVPEVDTSLASIDLSDVIFDTFGRGSLDLSSASPEQRAALLDGVTTEIRFSNTSALFDNDLVMVDRQTGTYWWQVAGLGIVGAPTDTELDVLPSTTMRWAQWLELHPDTLVLSRELGFGRDYTSDRFAALAASVDQGFTPFPVHGDALADGRLSPATRVVAVSGGTQTVAVPVSETPVAASFDLNGHPVVVLSSNGVGAAFSGVFEGAPMDIAATTSGFTDSISGVTFDLSGVSLTDPERALTALPSRSSFWFAIVAAFPEVTVVAPT